MYKAILFLLAFCLAGSFVSGQVDWQLVTEDQGIKVFVSNAPGSKIKALKVECELGASADEVVTLMLDIAATKEWMPHTKSCNLIRKVSATEFYYYTEVSLPWPMYNRDFVTHLRIFQDPISKVVTVDAPAIPGELDPKKGIVRITDSKGQWVFTPLAKNRLKLEYSLLVDPGGTIPAALVNYFATKASVETIKNMEKMLKLPKYQDADLPFILN